MANELLFEELTYKIIGVCYEVQNQLGGGLLEKTYQKALVIGLKAAGFSVEEEVKVPILFHNEQIAVGYADLLVNGKILIELKRTATFNRSQIQQLENYLTSCNLPLGLLIHFGQESVNVKRVINRTYFNNLKNRQG
jgi:GxxExxY protein